MANAALAFKPRKPKRAADNQRRPTLPEDPLDFAEAVRKRRISLGKSQQDFAVLVGVRFYALTEIEGGGRNRYPPTLIKKIAAGLGCDI